jgi:hypothetical protein
VGAWVYDKNIGKQFNVLSDTCIMLVYGFRNLEKLIGYAG